MGTHSTRPLEMIPDWGTRSSTPADQYLVYPYIGGSKLKRRIYGWSGASIGSDTGTTGAAIATLVEATGAVRDLGRTGARWEGSRRLGVGSDTSVDKELSSEFGVACRTEDSTGRGIGLGSLANTPRIREVTLQVPSSRRRAGLASLRARL